MSPESTVATRICAALAQHAKRDVSKIHLEDKLRADLGLDSLAMIELLFKVEEAFDLEIPNDDLSKITTVGDVVAYVEERLGSAASAARPAVSTAARGVLASTPLQTRVAAKPGGSTVKAAKRSAPKKKGSRRA
jgi:acyl carrier protein